jgi:protocatechuate 3,4-dioxygenase beta subunit
MFAKRLGSNHLWLTVLFLAACQGTVNLAVNPTSASPALDTISCAPTRSDQLGPFYVPGAPVRSMIGEGHLLSGFVRSSSDCEPIPNAQIEFWQVGPEGDYDDDHRATMFADDNGAYRFESNFPTAYSGRPPHIHIQVSADGSQTLVTQYYPGENQVEGTFDLVLIPSE